MTDRDILEVILKKIGVMDSKISDMDSKISYMDSKISDMDSKISYMEANMATKQELAEVKADVKFTRETVLKMEVDHGQKLGALFDGYKLNSEKLDRIEQEVSKHEEIILRRIR